MSVRTRFAPSPTGTLHLGSARTALYCWLHARRFGGQYVLRIEDTDQERSTQESVEQVLRVLGWLGLDWDEGPQVGGPHAPYVQSQRTELYDARVRDLLDGDKAYECFCTADELEAERRAAQGANRPLVYSGRCGQLSADQREQKRAQGLAATVRLRTPTDGETVVEDLILGRSSFENALVGDFIIRRSDGFPVYNFSCVVDDIDMKMTHVIRGNDHLSNTPRQILIYEALGAEIPEFAHVPMIVGADRKNLSKRHGAASVEELAEAGYLPQAVLNYLALLGWNRDEETTVMSVDEMVAAFDVANVNKSPAGFDYEKAAWINGQHLRALTPDRWAAAFDVWRRRWLVEGTPSHEAAFAVNAEDAAMLAQQKVETFSSVPEFLAFLGDDFSLSEEAWQRLLEVENAETVLAAVRNRLADLETWNVESVEGALRGACTDLGLKPRAVFGAVRFAITGRTVAPGLFESVAVLGRERSLERIDSASGRLLSVSA